jgi:hypothetical protein
MFIAQDTDSPCLKTPNITKAPSRQSSNHLLDPAVLANKLAGIISNPFSLLNSE